MNCFFTKLLVKIQLKSMRFILSTLAINFAILMSAQFQYPNTTKGDVVDDYFGNTIQDPYRWLEDDRAPETKNWVQQQNQFTENYLSKIPYRETIREELSQLMNNEKVYIPFIHAGVTYYFKNEGLQAQPILYKIDEEGKEELFLDPNSFSKDGTVSLMDFSFTKDGKLLAYQVSRGGSDWRDVYFMKTEDKTLLKDSLNHVKFSNMSWQGNNVFFYSTYPAVKGSLLSTQTSNHKVFRHEIGTLQKEDKVIFGDDENPRRYVVATISNDENYLFIEAANATNGNELYCYDLREKESRPFILQDDFEANTHYFFNEKEMIYLITDRDAPNRKIVKLDLNLKNRTESWYDFIPENKYVMSPSIIGDKIFIKYMVNAQDEIVVYAKGGNLLYQLELPGQGQVKGLYSNPDEDMTFYSFENYITPPTIYSYNTKENQSEFYTRSPIEFNPIDYLTEQVFYISHDGTEIPMTISYKKGTDLNDKNPTILYGYGGFNISLQPSFSETVAYWLSKGGVYAVPNLRGGGEYGSEWHDAGTQLNKKNVFKDFIAAAEYLFTQHYTSKEYLAIRGGSNGGLLVGATMCMQPDIAAVALPAVGVLDMLRYHEFTSGAGWAYDYGTSADSEEMFEYLHSYSPLHALKPNTCYPATLITTGDHDDRVVPAHSFKFAAQLQADQSCEKPTLIRIATDAGHGAGKSTSQIIEEYTDIYTFTFENIPNTQFKK